MGWKLFVLFVTIMASSMDFAHSVPVKVVSVGETINDEAVEELESLKNLIAKAKDVSDNKNEIFVNKSQTSILSNVNGHKSAHQEIKDEVSNNGKTFAKFSQKIDVLKNGEEKPKSAVQTEVEIPSKGIHYVIKSDSNKEVAPEKRDENDSQIKKIRNDIDKINSLSDFKYSPHYMAEYIFWTGDEKGVALTIEEFLQEGLMSRQEAINFLQSVKYNLDLMQSQYQGTDKVDEKIYNKGSFNKERKFLIKSEQTEKPKRDFYDEQLENTKLSSIDSADIKSDSSENNKKFSSRQSNAPKTESKSQLFSQKKKKNYLKLPIVSQTFEGGPDNYIDYEGVADRLKMGGFSENDYSLEEVIFELAEIVFSESLTKGNVEAQKAVQKFSAFLQKEVEDGQISRKLLRKILGILSSALINVISEHPELLNRSNDELQVILKQISPSSEALSQLLILGSKNLSDQYRAEKGPSEKTMMLEDKKLNIESLQSA